MFGRRSTQSGSTSAPSSAEAQADFLEEITSEHNLWEVWRTGRRIRGNWFNRVTTAVVFALLAVYAYFSPLSAHAMADQVRGLCDLGINFGASILGFILAGFTIFATVSKPDLLMEMARRTHPQSRLSYLKYNFTAFTEIIIYLVFVVLCLLVKLFAGISGPLSALMAHLPVVKHHLAEAGFVIVGTWFFYLLVILQSFVFNTYHFVMTGVRWDAEKKEREKEEREGNAPAQAGSDVPSPEAGTKTENE